MSHTGPKKSYPDGIELPNLFSEKGHLVQFFGHTNKVNNIEIEEYDIYRNHNDNCNSMVSVLDVFFIDLSLLIGLDNYVVLDHELTKFLNDRRFTNIPSILVILNEKAFKRDIIENILSPYIKKKIFSDIKYITDEIPLENQLQKVITHYRDIKNIELKLLRSRINVDNCIPYDYFLYIRDIEENAPNTEHNNSRNKPINLPFKSKYINEIKLKYILWVSLIAGFGFGLLSGWGNYTETNKWNYKFFIYPGLFVSILFLTLFAIFKIIVFVECYFYKRKITKYMQWLDEAINKIQSSSNINDLKNYKSILTYSPDFNTDYGTIYVSEEEANIHTLSESETGIGMRIICKYHHHDNLLYIDEIFSVNTYEIIK